MRSMLVFVPASIWLGLAHASPTPVFVVSCLAILPLAGLMGEATEHLAHRAGPGLGGLLNATFGNAAGTALGLGKVLVISGHLIGRPLGLEFTLLEVAAVMLSVLAVGQLVQDGRTNWFEGFQLLAVYAILAITFYFV